VRHARVRTDRNACNTDGPARPGSECGDFTWPFLPSVALLIAAACPR